MTAINFPSSPAVNDTFTAAGKTYRWTGATWVAVATPADVVGPSSATNNSVALFDGTTGKLIKSAGSALTFTNTAGYASVTQNGTSGAYLTLQTNGASNLQLASDGANGFVIGPASGGSLVFQQGGSEQMRLTTTGLGVGTSSPTGGRLNVSAADTSNTIGSGGAALSITNSDIAEFGRTVNLNFTVGDGNLSTRRLAGISAVYTAFGTSTAGALAFATDNGSGSFAERARIHADGGISIGTTTKSTSTSLTVAGGAIFTGTTPQISTGSPNFAGVAIGFDGSPNIGQIVAVNSSDAALAFWTKPVGGGAPVERMRIFAGGGVSIGNTSDPGAGNLYVDGQIQRGFNNAGTNTAAQALATYHVSQVTISANTTLTTTVPPAGTTARVIIVTSGTNSRTVTFGTGFASTGTLATGTAADRRFVIQFVSDGTRLLEMSRTTAITV
jgi:hypothetical protein